MFLTRNLTAFLVILSIGIMVVAVWYLDSAATNSPSANNSALDGVFDQMRIENEDKLDVPRDQVEEVWDYMVKRLVNNQDFLNSLAPGLDSYWYDERFTDVYFDTPELTFMKNQSAVRHRKRVNLSNPDHVKSGRELVQVKLNNIDDNEFNRGELKFEVEYQTNVKSRDDVSPVIGIITPSQRAEFKLVISELGVDPYSLKEILTNEQRRRSLYITRYGEQFISIRLDECSSSLLWSDWRHVELEPELNELPYTRADSTQRAFMESVNRRIGDDILQQFPEIKRDLTPKYNKAFNYFEEKIPLLRSLIRHGII